MWQHQGVSHRSSRQRDKKKRDNLGVQSCLFKRGVRGPETPSAPDDRPHLDGVRKVATRTPEAIAAETTDAGNTFQSKAWVVTLFDEPQQAEQSGAATAIETTNIGPEGSESGLRVAGRITVIIPVAVINETEKMAFPPKDLMNETDPQGRRSQSESCPAHAARVSRAERRGKKGDQLVQNPLEVRIACAHGLRRTDNL